MSEQSPPSACRGALLRSLAVLSVLLALTAAAAETLQTSDRAAIQAVIAQQIDAFRQDDGERAFSFASPTIREKFGTPEIFMEMVRGSYPAVYRAGSFRFAELILWRGKPTQRVILVGPAHEVFIALYEMQRQPDGEWKINGCFLLPAEEKAT